MTDPSDREVLARHPTQPFGIRRLADGEIAGRLQVFDLSTGEAHGKPMEAVSMGWCLGGEELLLLREVEAYTFVVERLSWPDEKLVCRSSQLPFSSAWDIVAAPEQPYAALLWIDQGESGYAIFDLGTLEELEAAGFGSSEVLLTPVFSPDGRLFAGSSEEAPIWCTPTGEELSERSPIARVGTMIVALAGTWDYLEVPIVVEVGPDTSLDALEWPRRDDGVGPRFVNDHEVEILLPDGRPLVMDVEALRTSPKWLAERARRELARRMEIEADEQRLASIATHNASVAQHAKLLFPRDLTCPHCGATGGKVRYHPGTPQERALFVCTACGRSFGAQ